MRKIISAVDIGKRGKWEIDLISMIPKRWCSSLLLISLSCLFDHLCFFSLESGFTRLHIM